MLTLEDLVRFVSRKSNSSMAHPVLVIFLLLPLAGCTGEGGGGPTISSLSTPTKATAGDGSESNPDSEAEDSAAEQDPIITMTSTPTGVTANLTWAHPTDIKVAGYQIHYEKRSSEKPDSEEVSAEESNSDKPSLCSYGESQTVEAPAATIVGLEPNTPYVFAIRAFNESESLCSNEIPVVTPPAQA